MRKLEGKFLIIPLILVCAMGSSVSAALAQEKVNLPPKPGSQSSLTPARERNPATLRTALLAIHGFSRQSLDAATLDAPLLLRQIISDSTESVTLHRQAVKALRLYPSNENLEFIQARVGLAPVGLKRLYAATLGRYSGALQPKAAAVLRTLVGDPDSGVRHAAIGAVRLLGVDAESRKAFEGRLSVEPDPAVKRALSTALQD